MASTARLPPRLRRYTPAHVQTADAIVVLGAKVSATGEACLSLRFRVAHAVMLFHAQAAPLLVFSGGAPKGRPSEASVARALAVAEKVSPAACLCEERSRSTHENARFTARLLADRPVKKILLVTDGYHMPRARWLFTRAGFEVVPAPSPRPWNTRSAPSRTWWRMRELAALVKDALFSR
ncbi:MAG: YdcF family protein [Myxococcaceae bacterium]|nr:YdcF family protein [Myxococcaceae bacterium]